MVDQLVEQHPEPQVVLGKAPLAPEGVEVGGDDEQFVGDGSGRGTSY
jgi:hypothetical protein